MGKRNEEGGVGDGVWEKKSVVMGGKMEERWVGGVTKR